MSTTKLAPKAKIFGMELAIDAKVIVLALLILAGLIFYFTSSTDPSGGSSNSQTTVNQAPVVARPAVNPALARSAASRRANASRGDRDTLKLIAVDGSRGDVDPTLHLRLLDRVKNVPPAAGLRNLFEAGGAVLATDLPKLPPHPPKIAVNPFPMQAANQPPPQQAAPPFVIPLKYYGFAKSNARAVDGNRGLFMDGDNILIGSEGDLIEKRFLIVALTPSMARLEDTQTRQGQDLQVTPEATAQ